MLRVMSHGTKTKVVIAIYLLEYDYVEAILQTVNVILFI